MPWGTLDLGVVWAAPCNVLDYGADNNFTYSATIPIQNAIDAAHAGDCDGEVYFPAGTYKLTDSVKPKSYVTLNIVPEATLKVSENQSDLSSIFRVVYLDGVSNVVIKGGGTIDASGPFYHNDDGTRVSGNRPDLLLFVKKSDNITVEDVTLKDSVNWTFPIYDSNYVTVDNVTIRNPPYGEAHHTDGIDIVASRHVTVRNCDIETGDDAIVIKSKPFDEDTWGNLPDMHDILVENSVVASTCNATKIGTETSNDIYYVTFRNITVNRHTDGGLNTAGISVQSNDGNSVHDIEFINYTINNAFCPIFIGLQDRDSYISGDIGKVYNITFKNINATSNYQPIFFNADESDTGIIETVTLEDITIHNYGTNAGRVPDEMDGSYPDANRYGIADAYGLWARDTNGLILKGNINFYDDGNSGRAMTALWDNVTNIIDHPGAFQESGGLVVMEAENYNANDMRSDPNDYNWQLSSSTGGYVGDGYVDTPLPHGTNATWDNACELTYQIEFGTMGTYNIWLRRYANDGTTNSGYVGMNGTQAGGFDNGGNYGSWVWKKMGTVSVSSSGERTFNLRRREAGYQVDRILMTTYAGYTPSGDGPAESPHGGPQQDSGDFDSDCDVGGSDLAVFAADFGRTDCASGPTCEGDFDGDGDVDDSDLAVFAADFGRTDCP
jgi:polygalacturonase